MPSNTAEELNQENRRNRAIFGRATNALSRLTSAFRRRRRIEVTDISAPRNGISEAFTSKNRIAAFEEPYSNNQSDGRLEAENIKYIF